MTPERAAPIEAPLPERPLGVALVAGWFALAGAVLATMGLRFSNALEFISSEFGIWLLTISSIVVAILAIAAITIAIGLWRGRPIAKKVACFILIAAIAITLVNVLSLVRTLPLGGVGTPESGRVVVNRVLSELWPLVLNAIALKLLMRERAKAYFGQQRHDHASHRR